MPQRIRMNSLDYLAEIYAQVQDRWFRYLDLKNPSFNQRVFKGMYNEKSLLRKTTGGRFHYWRIAPSAIEVLERGREK